jgi:hypothetical protein
MKRLILVSVAVFLFACPARAEAVKLKNGIIINGSIVGQTEYVLSVQTSYGTISINQREVDSILPDLHRVLLKGGGEFVGNVLDLDEFNLSLKTDNGVINIDTAQIASMEIYDYGEAEKQKKYVEKKVELEQKALEALPAGADAAQAAETAASGSLSSSGLSFDPDLEKAFPSKPEVVAPETKYNYRIHTYQGEDIAGETPEAQTPDIPAQEEEDTFDQAKKKNNSYNYFAVNAGIINTALKMDLSALGGIKEQDAGGTTAAFGLEYKRKLGRRLWLGGTFTFGLLPGRFITLSPVQEIKTSGQAVDIDVLANFYLNPDSQTRFYLIGGGGVNILSLNRNSIVFNPGASGGGGWEVSATDSLGQTNISAVGGLGVERAVADITVGLELRAHYVPYGGALEGSRAFNCYGLLKASWFF